MIRFFLIYCVQYAPISSESYGDLLLLLVEVDPTRTNIGIFTGMDRTTDAPRVSWKVKRISRNLMYSLIYLRETPILSSVRLMFLFNASSSKLSALSVDCMASSSELNSRVMTPSAPETGEKSNESSRRSISPWSSSSLCLVK